MVEDRFTNILHRYWGYPDFRGIQRDIIESVAAGRDTLGLMPTGGGKSLTFQVPAMGADGVCVVVTPLIALMKDQVLNLRKRGIKADAIYSGRSRSEIIQVLENSIFGGVKILYVSPERLSSELFQIKFRHMKVSFITVDEAHCISQWGYDFRPSYLEIAAIRNIKPDVPVLALTATATPRVVDDIQERLAFKEKNVFRMSFERRNLAYIVRKTPDKPSQLIHILNSVAGSAIVYVRSRKRTKEMAALLTENGINATFYHAGLDTAVKDERQRAWTDDQVRVIVATNAFGMGIDKPDVRVVVHIDCPDSLEAYFQEAGRAGRDGKKAYAVLIYDGSDEHKFHKRIAENFPEKDYIRDVYEHLAYFYQIGVGSGCGRTFAFDIGRFCFTYKYFPTYVDSALRLLEHAGYIHYESDPNDNARVIFTVSRYTLDHLEDLSKNEENVLTSLMRLYTGIFAEYVYIDESLVAQQAGLDRQQVYMILKNLSHRKVIHFIPRSKTPYITYLQDREEEKYVIIPKEVYETRKEQYVNRIEAFLQYAKGEHVCRSRQLLLYFGEETSQDCGHCDVCIEHQQDLTSDTNLKEAKDQILNLLNDGKRHHVTEINKILLPPVQVQEALRFLIHEETVRVDASFLFL